MDEVSGLLAVGVAAPRRPKRANRGEGFGRGSPDGLGLGLTIIARLAGDLRIVQEGDGTEVRMRFPLPA